MKEVRYEHHFLQMANILFVVVRIIIFMCGRHQICFRLLPLEKTEMIFGSVFNVFFL